MKVSESRRLALILKKLDTLYPQPDTPLHHSNPLQLLIATILSAQCTDERVNRITPALFEKFRSAKDFAQAKLSELEALIRTAGFYHQKALSIQGTCRMILEEFGGEVPERMEDLVRLPGVGRKTANVVLGNAFKIPGLPVDTHVKRLSLRLGLTVHSDPEKTERDLMQWVPKMHWSDFSLQLIFHGRKICVARKPRCDQCLLNELCPKKGVKGIKG